MQSYEKYFKYPNLPLFIQKNMQKNNIFSKKSQKICIFEKNFVTLQPIKSVVRFLRTCLTCEKV